MEDVLEAIVAAHPAAQGQSPKMPLQALIFDSWFDIYRGAVVLVRVMEGRIPQAHEDPPGGQQRSLRSRSSSACSLPNPLP